MLVKKCLLTLSIFYCINLIDAINHRKCLSHLPKEYVEFIILHNNDIHGRFDQIDSDGGSCSSELAQANKCYGGFARIAHIVRSYRNIANLPGGIPVIYLYAGDMFTGTTWFTLFKDKISSNLMNRLKPDALTLGNHEFDEGIKGLVPYIQNINSPFVVSNLDVSNTPKLRNIKNLVKSTILNIGTTKIGIIGYLTPETIGASSTGNINLNPEIESLKKESAKLKEHGINIVIALGHSGYNVDKEIAKKCPDIDIVVGAHTHSYLSSNCKNPLFKEIIEGPYPTGVRQSSGKVVPVVQAFAFTKYLGYLKVKFDKYGKLISWNGLPILLDSYIPQEQDIIDIVNQYRPQVDALAVEIGQTSVDLDGTRDNCRNRECVIGNLIADAMVYCAQIRKPSLNEFIYSKKSQSSSDVCVGFINSGAFRGGINTTTSNGSITLNDVILILPYNSSVSRITVTGSKILHNLEISAGYYKTDKGGFLQFSGIKVTFDMAKPIGQRIIKVQIRENCNNNNFEELKLEKQYNIVMPTYILNGGDNFNWLDTSLNQESKSLDCTDTISLADYIRNHSPLNHTLEGRHVHI